MARTAWANRHSLTRAVENLRREAKGDWYRDPWGWPEYDHLLSHGGASIRARLRESSLPRPVAELDVPKENFGTRPAMVMDLLDRVTYQLLVDHVSGEIVGDMSPQAFGWRLPVKARGVGEYARQDYQWSGYRGELSMLSGMFEAALKTDIASCFSSVRIDLLIAEVASRATDTPVVDKLYRLLTGWEQVTSRTGLPQRSTASSVLANMYLSPLDEIMDSHSTGLEIRWPSNLPIRSHVRWMDDMWLFSNDIAKIRSAQVDLETAVRSLRLVLNSGKTKVLEDETLREVARKIQHSAVDDALLDDPADERPLEELIDEILESPETADRTTVRFVTTRMRRHRIDYRVPDIIDAASRMPHAADSLSRLFKRKLHGADIQDWFMEFDTSDWNCFDWSWAQFGTALTSKRKPRAAVRERFESHIALSEGSLPSLALASQRLAAWDKSTARTLIAERMRHEQSGHIRRVLSLAALGAGESPRRVRAWLRGHEQTVVTLRMLEAKGFVMPPLAKDFV